MTKTLNKNCRPRDHLTAVGRDYPKAWSIASEFRERRGKDLPNWPDWCYMPFAGAEGIISEKSGDDILHRLSKATDMARVAALVAWRPTQGIYRFDETLYESIVKTPVKGDIPCNVLYRMPEWCVYLETPEMSFQGSDIYGAFVHLDWNEDQEHEELRILIDAEVGLTPVNIHIGPWGLDAAKARIHYEMSKNFNVKSVQWGFGLDFDAMKSILIEPILSLLLYICSEDADMGNGGRKPGRPVPVKTKKGLRTFPPDKPNTWDVGVRLGAALRRACAVSNESNESEGDIQGRSSPRGHVRRAHWHSFLTGPRSGDQHRVLKWMPPIPVNMTLGDDTPSVIKPVKDED